MRLTASTDPGCKHDDNQDCYRAGRLSDGTFWVILCDGMGGVSAGGKASMMAVDFLNKCIDKKLSDIMTPEGVRDFMLEAIRDCNALIYKNSRDAHNLITMGTTLVFAVVRGALAQVAHAGDSRAYIVGRKIKQVTHDHSVVQELLDSKKITSEQARNHPNKNIITSALGVEDSIRVDYNEQHISKGDSLLICTDGLSNMITDEDIMQVVQECDFYKTADILVKMAREAGGYDNITAVLLSM